MSKRSLVEHTRALVLAGVMEMPIWMAALERTPPLPVTKPRKQSKPPAIKFPEDRLIEAYYRRHPEARLEPLDLASFKPPTARLFALRQLELMQSKGLSARQTEKVVEFEFAARRRQAEEAAGNARQSVIEQVQAAEEAQLQQAVRRYASTHGTEAVRQHAQELAESLQARRAASHQQHVAAAAQRQRLSSGKERAEQHWQHAKQGQQGQEQGKRWQRAAPGGGPKS